MSSKFHSKCYLEVFPQTVIMVIMVMLLATPSMGAQNYSEVTYDNFELSFDTFSTNSGEAQSGAYQNHFFTGQLPVTGIEAAISNESLVDLAGFACQLYYSRYLSNHAPIPGINLILLSYLNKIRAEWFDRPIKVSDLDHPKCYGGINHAHIIGTIPGDYSCDAVVATRTCRNSKNAELPGIPENIPRHTCQQRP